MKRGLVFVVLAGALGLLLAGCCGSVELDRSKVTTLPIEKALDATHRDLAARADGKLYAGAAVVDITTDLVRKEGIYIGGFDMGRKSTGVRDPVYAHVLYLDDGRQPFVLVTMDTIGFMNDDIRALKALATDAWQDGIIIASTHDHVGPDLVGYWGPACAGVLPVCSGKVLHYVENVKYLVANAIDQAARSARPARLRVAEFDVDPELSLNIHKEIRKQKDDRARVLVAEGEDGKVIATLANWGCHAEALWNDSQLSADWPGVFYQRVQQELGGVALFAQGALGGLVTINPGDDKMATEPEIMDVFLKHMTTAERVALRDRIGNAFADQVIKAVKGATRTFGPEGVRLTMGAKRVELENSNWVFRYMFSRGLIERRARWDGDRMFMTTDFAGLRIRSGDQVVVDLSSVPGEPAPPLVQEFDATSPALVKFNIALGNDEIGYIVREADWELPQYEYEQTMSLGKGTGTKVLQVLREIRAGL